MTTNTVVRPELHYASDRRCYQGAPCSDLRREWASLDNIRKQIMAIMPTFWTTYFPVEGKYGSSYWDEDGKFQEISGNLHNDVGDALLEAWDKLVGEEQP